MGRIQVVESVLIKVHVTTNAEKPEWSMSMRPVLK
jgi:hypothetical protein